MNVLIKTDVYEKWLRRLTNKDVKAKILEKVFRLQNDMSIDTRSVGNGVKEIRVFVDKGYRIYFANENGHLIILLCGGHKDTQARDICESIIETVEE